MADYSFIDTYTKCLYPIVSFFHFSVVTVAIIFWLSRYVLGNLCNTFLDSFTTDHGNRFTWNWLSQAKNLGDNGESLDDILPIITSEVSILELDG